MIRLEEGFRIWRVMTIPRLSITRLQPGDDANDLRTSQAREADAGFEHSKMP